MIGMAGGPSTLSEKAGAEKSAANVWVLFEASGTAYAIPSESVLAVHEVPVITPLPFAPPFVDGLIGVPGSVCVLVDLPRRLVAGPPSRRRPGQAAIRLVADHGTAALRVDRVLRLARFDRIAWHGIDDTAGEDRPTAIVGTGWVGEQEAVLLDPEHCALGDLQPTDHLEVGSDWVNAAAAATAMAPEEKRAPYLIVENQTHRYAIPVNDTLEVVPALPVTPIPMGPPAIGGIVTLRGMPLLVAWLDRLLGQELGICRDFVIMALGELRFGLGVERVMRLERLPVRPQYMATPLHGRLDTYHVLSDSTIAHVLSLSDFLDSTLRAAIRGFAPGSYDRRLGGNAVVPQKRLLVFRIGAELCALPLDEIERVAPLTLSVPLPPDAESDIDSAVESGGEIVPVSSLRKLFGVQAGRETNCILVRSKQGTMGLGIDTIVGLASVPLTSIEPVGNPRGPIREFARHDNQLMWILSTQAIAGQTASQAPNQTKTPSVADATA
jgi:chemotaxis signal transduction protein